MATVKQIQFRIKQAKNKLTKLNKEVKATKIRMKKLQTQIKEAQGV